MITGITHRSGEMRVKLKQYQGNSPKTKEKAGKSLIQKISKRAKISIKDDIRIENARKINS